MAEYTIVVPDNDIISCVCGTNDSNLRLIEENLGVSVFTRGNELYIDDSDKEVCQKFQFIIDRIVDEINDGGLNSEDIVVSVLNTQKKVNADEISITVPGAVKKIYPRTQNQAEYINKLQTKDIVFCTGSAGSGKTFLAVAEALRLVLSHKKNKLVITRPVVEAGESLGYLPGDLEQKINPYLRPLRDAMDALLSPESVRKLMDAGIIEVAPLAYMRGRSIHNACIILDEAQNTTQAQMKMFLTRIGENSCAIITGDVTQIDLPKASASGLVQAREILRDIDGISFVNFTARDTVRSRIVQRIIDAYEKN